METAPPSVDKNRRAIQQMFAGVASRYDLLNHLLSAGLDGWWRRRAARALGTLQRGALVLDLCCGTGDQSIALRRQGLAPIGADFCLPMLALARPKLRRGSVTSPPLAADALACPFPAATFAAATVSFGLRNVADLDAALAEIARLLAPGGKLAILEFALPVRQPWRSLYLFYFRRLLPRIGKLLSRRSSAYAYLPASVLEFPQRNDFTARLERAGFVDCSWRDLSGGVVCLYLGTEGRAQPREVAGETVRLLSS